MKNIFRAVAQTSSVLKSFKVLMLILLATIGVTSCESQTETTPLAKSEAVSESTLTNIATQVSTENSPMKIGDTPGAETRRLCIGGGGAGQERRNLIIGNQPAPRSLSEIGGQETSKRFVAIGGNGAGSSLPRNLLAMENYKQNFEIGGTLGAQRSLTEIGGQGCPRQFSEIGDTNGTERRNIIAGRNQTAPRNLCEIGGPDSPRKLSDIGGNGGSIPPRSVFEIAPDAIPIGGNFAPRA